MPIDAGEMEDLLFWQELCNGLGLRDPKIKRLLRDQRRACACVIALMGAFEMYWLAVDIVARFRAQREWKTMLRPSVPKYLCGYRKVIMDEALLKAERRRDYDEIFRLRRLCAYYQAEELIEIYSGYLGDICGAVPGARDRRFGPWLKELDRAGKITISGKGWKKVVKLVREW